MRTAVALLSLFLVRAALAQDPTPTPQPPMKWTGVLDEKAFAALHDLKTEAAPPLHGAMVDVGDGKAYLSLPEGKPPFPGVVVIHEWWGLNDHIKHWADRMAADGYAALAVDLYRSAVATTREEALAAMQAVDPEQARATLLAAHAFLAHDARIAAPKRGCIGWCFGGGWSLQLALAAPDLDAAVLYYGRLVNDPKALAAIHAPMLAVFGNRDQSIPPKAVDEFEAAMKQTGKALKVLRYDADHAFANPSGAHYDAEHADAAWREVHAFFAEHLKGEAGSGVAQVPCFAADDPRVKTNGFIRQTLRLEREVDGVRHTLMAFAVGDTLTLGAMVAGEFRGRVHWTVGGSELDLPFDTAAREPVAVEAKGAAAQAGTLRGEIGSFRGTSWVNVELPRAAWPEPGAALRLEFQPDKGEGRSLPAEGAYRVQFSDASR